MKKRFLIIISILMVVLIAIVYFFFDKSQEEQSEEQEEEQSEEQKEQLIEYYSKQYDISLISDEFRNEEHEKKFTEYQDKLEEAIKNYEEAGFLEEDRPNSDFFIEKARYAKYLGQADWAIEILNNGLEYYDNFSVAWNNLAKLYEDKKDYIKANEYYQTIINTFSERLYWNLYNDMSKNTMLMDNKIKTQEYYEKYQSFGGFDGEVEDYLNIN